MHHSVIVRGNPISVNAQRANNLRNEARNCLMKAVALALLLPASVTMFFGFLSSEPAFESNPTWLFPVYMIVAGASISIGIIVLVARQLAKFRKLLHEIDAQWVRIQKGQEITLV